ncbi:unnamed protein product [Echinostoma caproni]|uniref:Cadherin domain-containing protein n=1 Tax=Echinostoma caproni TaxID=27848 RepID=A0A183ALH4_9TREM|nr:unnamed protein product [Echinostoma caproni]
MHTLKLAISHHGTHQLQVIDTHNQSVSVANEEDNLRLEIRLSRESASLTTVDYCVAISVDNDSAMTNIEKMRGDISREVYRRRCAKSEQIPELPIQELITLRETLWPPVLSTNPVQLSDSFQLLHVRAKNQYVQFICQLTDCTGTPDECVLRSFHKKLCKEGNPDWNVTNSFLISPNIQVLRSNVHKATSCPSFSCLSLQQLLFACLGLIILDLLICGLLFWIYRRRNRNIRNASIPRPESIASLAPLPTTIAWTFPVEKKPVCGYNTHRTACTVPGTFAATSVGNLSEAVDHWVHTQLLDQDKRIPSIGGVPGRQHRLVTCDLSCPHELETSQLFLDLNEGKYHLLETGNDMCLNQEII